MADRNRPSNGLTPYEQGREGGRQDRVLDEHAKHLDKINGSIEKFATSLHDLSNEIRTLREEATLREDRVSTAAAVLATETERRRETLASELASGDRTFTRTERIFATSIGAIVSVLAIISALRGWPL